MNPTDIISNIHDAYQKLASPPRTYLGASGIGRAMNCARRGFYDFRHASGTEEFDGRKLRLFDHGHTEEERIIRDLRRAGYLVHAHGPGTRQIDVGAFNGLVRGHIDGLIRSTTSPWHLLECKTSSRKRFDSAFVKSDDDATLKDVREVHYAQMQTYMGLLQVQFPDWVQPQQPPEAGIYICVCKDTDRMHVERVEFDRDYFESIGELARVILTADTPPPRGFDYPKKHPDACLFCQHSDICWDQVDPESVCGTCTHYKTDTTKGAHVCTLHKRTTKTHLTCDNYSRHATYDEDEVIRVDWS